jgi:hypothetical protein
MADAPGGLTERFAGGSTASALKRRRRRRRRRKRKRKCAEVRCDAQSGVVGCTT